MPTPPSRFPWLRLRPLVPPNMEWLYWQTLATQEARTPFIEHLDLAPHTRWCDIGIGLGALAFEALYRYPQAVCTGLDRDPAVLAFLDRAAGVTGLRGRLRLVEGDAAAPPPMGPFDLLTARFVLQHVADPRRVIHAARGLLGRGGRLFVMEVDDGATVTDPDPPPDARALLEALRAVQAEAGGDRERGRRLPGMMMEAGFEVAVIPLTRAHVYASGAEREASFRVEESRLRAMASNLQRVLGADARTLEVLIAAYRAWSLSLRFAMVTELGVEGRLPSVAGADLTGAGRTGPSA